MTFRITTSPFTRILGVNEDTGMFETYGYEHDLRLVIYLNPFGTSVTY